MQLHVLESWGGLETALAQWLFASKTNKVKTNLCSVGHEYFQGKEFALLARNRIGRLG